MTICNCVDVVCEKLSTLFNGGVEHEDTSSEDYLVVPPVWIEEYKIYKNYGLAYMTNQGNTGAHFNDNSTIIEFFNDDNLNFLYRERNEQTGKTNQILLKEKDDNHTKDHIKKIRLLQHFKDKFDNYDNNCITTSCVYIKKWMKMKWTKMNKEVYFFRLSTNHLQIIFEDNVVLIMTDNAVTIIDNDKMNYTVRLNNIKTHHLYDKLQLEFKLMYIKDVLTSLIAKRKKKDSPLPPRSDATTVASITKGKYNVPASIFEYYYNDVGAEFIREWKIGKYIGSGGYSEVYEIIKSSDGTVYAGKFIPKKDLTTQKSKERLRNEVKIHKKLKHPHIVEFHSFIEDKNYFIIVMEHCKTNSLKTKLKTKKRFTEKEIRQYLIQILDGLKYLRDNNIVHHDIKLGNIYLTHNNEIKIGDFGLSVQFDFPNDVRYNTTRLVVGTPNYIAPEVINHKSHSYEVDVWSLGVVVYTMLIGRSPFDTHDIKITYNRIRTGLYCFPAHITTSKNIKDLIQLLLQVDSWKRPSIEEIQQHPFILSEDEGHDEGDTSIEVYTQHTLQPSITLKTPKNPGNVEVVKIPQ